MRAVGVLAQNARVP